MYWPTRFPPKFGKRFPGSIGTPAGSAAVPWYLAGGAPDPLAVWVGKGAASLAASYVNLVNPGTYNLASIGPDPTLQATGWLCGGQAMRTGIVPALTYSFVIRFSGQNDAIRTFAGCITSASQNFYIRHSGATNTHFRNGNAEQYVLGGFRAAGVYGMASKTIFLDGVQGTSIAAGGTDPTHEAYLMAVNNAGTAQQVLSQGNVQAAAWWNSTLTPAQMIAVQTAMALL